jgi:hypothetical protein
MSEINPFEVLRLDPTATEEEVIRHAGRLRQRATEEAVHTAIRQAVQSLTASAAARQLHSLMTHPRPGYQEETLDRFVAAFRRAPLPDASPVPIPPVDLDEFAALVRAAAAGALDLAAGEFEGILAEEPAEEIQRQTVEALWQNLLFDPYA